MSDPGLRALSALGLLAWLGIAWALSLDRRRTPWRTVAWALGLELALGALLLRTGAGSAFFAGARVAVEALTSWTLEGSRFVFGALVDTGFSIVVHVLPVIVFVGSLFSILYHLGVVQPVVSALSLLLRRTLRTSGAESLAAAANVFVGMVEAPLLVRPYVERMTRSELFTVMVTGMSTVSGSVLVVYAGMLGADYAGHLVTASLLAAPAGIAISKVMLPESEVPETASGEGTRVELRAANAIDAAAVGALAGLRLAGYVGALLIAFVALIALCNDLLGAAGGWAGVPDLTLQQLLGYAFAAPALLLGVTPGDAAAVGSLLGVKTVLNEFLAYQQLAVAIEAGEISRRSAVIASYALCGFANFGSLAILLGGLGGLAPGRRPEIARLGLRSIVAGTLATCTAGCIAGLLL